MVVTAQKVTLPTASAYTQTPIYALANGVVEFGLRLSQLQPDSTDVAYTVTAATQNRLDLVSNAFYGSPAYGWAIADVTGLPDQLFMPIGTQLRIPAKARLPSL